MNATDSQRFVVLTGGIGGAKLALGLDRVLEAGQLTAIVNTGDDFEHLGLAISPDIDTLVYTLADLVNPDTGWGCRDETWQFMTQLERLGGETWFRLGDRDLAMHVERTRRLQAHETLSAVTAGFCRRLGITSRVLPMSNDPVRTRIDTDAGWLDFQHYFVRDRCAPAVRRLEYSGAADARPAAGVLAALGDPALGGVFIAPSNPWLSIAPLLAIPGLAQALRDTPAPVIAVSPIVGAAAIKGPTAKIMGELGLTVSAAAVARHYQEYLDGFILDESDRQMIETIEQSGTRVMTCNTIMTSLDDRMQLARDALTWAHQLTEGHA